MKKYPYIVKQLKDFREGTRISDVMGPAVKNLANEQIEALAQTARGRRMPSPSRLWWAVQGSNLRPLD